MEENFYRISSGFTLVEQGPLSQFNMWIYRPRQKAFQDRSICFYDVDLSMERLHLL